MLRNFDFMIFAKLYIIIYFMNNVAVISKSVFEKFLGKFNFIYAHMSLLK
jgi:hypothetical protein